MKKYNYFDDNDVNNSIYDQKDDIYNIAKSIRERIANQNSNNPKENFEKFSEEIIEENNKLTLADLKQRARDGELFRSISWTNIRNALSFKDTRMRVALPVIVISILLISIIAFSYQINASSKKISLFSQAAGQVCSVKTAEYGYPTFEALNEKYGKNVNKLVGVCFARELDFNNDGKSELLICYNDGGVYFNEIYGFDKHKDFVSLYKKAACNVKDIEHGEFIALYRKNNKYYIAANEEIGENEKKDKKDETSESSTVQRIDLFTLSGKSFKKKYTFDYDYVNEAFSRKGKIDLEHFEKIKLSCIKNAESERRIAQTTEVINSFDSSDVKIDSSVDSAHKMNSAYFNLVQDYNAKYGSAKIVEKDGIIAINGLSVVKQIDFNGDGVNELMLIYRKQISKRSTDKRGNYISIPRDEYFCEIFKWTGEKVIRVFRSDCISERSANGADSYYIIKKNGNDSYYCENSAVSEERGNVITYSSKIYEMDDLSFKKTYEAIKKHSWGYDSFYLDGKRLKKKEFQNRGFEVALFLTDSDEYDKNVYNIGFVKRKTNNRVDVENQLKSTIEEIQKLNKQYVHE